MNAAPAPAATSFTGTVEFAPSFQSRPQITHVLFDFDGTLSLIREGWPETVFASNKQRPEAESFTRCAANNRSVRVQAGRCSRAARYQVRLLHG
jgi:hypothetical protein